MQKDIERSLGLGKLSPADREVVIPQSLVRELFAEGKRIFGDRLNRSRDEYNNPRLVTPRSRLSERFGGLTFGDNPTKYYFVYYSEIASFVTGELTEREACVSTEQSRHSTCDKKTEIKYEEGYDHTYATIKHSINNRWRWDSNDDYDDYEKPEQPDGVMSRTYELLDTDRMQMKHLGIDRADEIMLDYNGISRPARWSRSLLMSHDPTLSIYSDFYSLNRSADWSNEQHGNIKFEIKGTLDLPTQIIITLGTYDKKGVTVISEDADRGIKVVGYKGFKEDLQILQLMPEYASLLNGQFDTSEVVKLVKDKALTLKLHWSEPKTVFSNELPLTEPTN